MRIGKVALLLALLFGLTSVASAATIFVNSSFSGPTASAGLTPFNSALGTLTSVEITISGTVSVTVLTNPPTVAGIPIPMPFLVSVNQNFTGSPSHDGFSFTNPATFLFSGIASGGSQTLSASFMDTFHFNGITDLVGFATNSFTSSVAETPSALVNGKLSGFTGAIPLSELVQTTGNMNSPFATITSASSDGSIIVEYDYTPATAPVPEPRAFLMLAAGLVALFATRMVVERV